MYTIIYNNINLRCIAEYKKIWVCLLDIGKCVRHTNVRGFLHQNKSLIDAQKFTINTSGGSQKLIFINQADVLFLLSKNEILSSAEKNDFLNFLQNNNIITMKYQVQSRKEIEFFDMLVNVLEPFNLTCIKQYQVLNYKIDLYIKELNIAIEYDEKHHISSLKKDKERELEIKKLINCYFIRVSSEASDYWNIGYIIKELTKNHKYE